MKELSIEEKAKRYDEALEKFPELKESEDDKVRKKLIHLVKKSHEQGGYALHKWESDEMLTWLEKQGKKDEEILILKDQIESLQAAIKAIKETHRIELEKQGDANKEYWRGYREGKQEIIDKYAELEKQEIKEHDVCDTCDEKASCVNPCPMKLIEEQKHTDKVEPKFKVGDWIISDDKDVHDDYRVCKITKIYDGRYYIEGGGFLSESSLVLYEYRLWTIQDAKDGDILITKNKNIFIFKSISDCTIYHYCGLYFERFVNSSGTVNGKAATQLPIDYIPATKEQRDLLFTKMKEAGYEWDAEKKELKKIEQYPPNWSEEDERMLELIGKAAYTANTYKDKCKIKNWFKSLKPHNTWKPSEFLNKISYGTDKEFR